MSSSRVARLIPVLLLSGFLAVGCSKALPSEGAATVEQGAPVAADETILTGADVDLFIASAQKFKAYAAAHPDFDQDEIGVETSETPAEYAARVEATPALKAAFDATGTAPAAFARSASLITGAMFGAAMAQGKDPKTLPQPVQYYLAHKAEIDQRIRQVGSDPAE